MLTGKNIYLRTIEPSDAEIILQWENNPENWKVSNTLVPFSKKLIEDYVNSAQDIYMVKQIRFMVCLNEDNRPIGSVDLFDLDLMNQKVGVGILIDNKEDRRKGCALESIGLIKEYCFEVLNLHQLYCNILTNNQASIELFKKAGFTICGTKKDWLKTKEGWQDELMLQLFVS